MKRQPPKTKATPKAALKRKKRAKQREIKVSLREQMDALKKKYRSSRRQLKATEKEVERYRNALSVVLAWGDTVDGRLNEMAAEIANLFKLQQISDSGAIFERPTLRSALGQLAELGALPIDANAAAIFKRPLA